MALSQLENRGLAATYALSNETFTPGLQKILETQVNNLKKKNNTTSSAAPLSPEFLSQVKQQNLNVTHSAKKLQFVNIAQWILLALTAYAIAHAIISPVTHIPIATLFGVLTIIAGSLFSKYKNGQTSEVSKLAQLILPNLGKLGDLKGILNNESSFSVLNMTKPAEEPPPDRSMNWFQLLANSKIAQTPDEIPYGETRTRSLSLPLPPHQTCEIKKSPSLPNLLVKSESDPLTLTFVSNHKPSSTLPMGSGIKSESSSEISLVLDEVSPMDNTAFFHRILCLVIKDHDCELSESQSQGLLILLSTPVEIENNITQYHELANAINQISEDRIKTVNILTNIMFLRYGGQLKLNLSDTMLTTIVETSIDPRVSHLTKLLANSSHALATQILNAMDDQYPNNKIEENEALYFEYLIHVEFKTLFEEILESETKPQKEIAAAELKKKITELMPGLNISAAEAAINASAEAILNEVLYPTAIASTLDLQGDSTTEGSLALSAVSERDPHDFDE